MKFFIMLMIALPNAVFAHCPAELSVDGKTYCTNVKWLNGERKIQGKFQPTNEHSPQLVLMGEIPQRWIYSKAEFVFWEKGDHDHIPKTIEGLRIFPYMNMEDGHHHSTSYSFNWTSTSYEISSIVFQEMPGCWSFRWTTAEDDSLEKSEFLMNVEGYDNLAQDENMEMSGFCSNSEPDAGEGGGHHHSH